MDIRRRPSELAEELAVRGKACIAAGSSCVHRPAVASSSHEARRTTVTATLRKSGSIGNLHNHNAHTGCSNQTRADFNDAKCSKCKCHRLFNDIQASQLQEQYTRQLQQQIYFLELENNYLRQGEQNMRERNRESNEMLVRTRAIPHVERSLHSYSDYLKQLDVCSSRASQPSPSDDFSLQNGVLFDLKPTLDTSQAELLQKLEDAYQRESKLEERIKEKLIELNDLKNENAKLVKKVDDLTAEQSKNQEKHFRDRRGLVEEIVELQRRLDDLTPTLALKESQIAKLESEKDLANSKLRSATNELHTLQMQLDETKEEEAKTSRLESERREEIESLKKNLKRFESEVDDYRSKERTLAEDISDLRRALREEELQAKKEKAMTQKVMEENNSLIKENSHLCAKISLLESEIGQIRKELDIRKANEISAVEVAEIRELEKQSRIEISRLQEKLKIEQERSRNFESQFEDNQKKEEEKVQWRTHMQREFEGLQALSSSLSSENKLLRQDKLIMDDRCKELQSMLRKKEEELENVKERCEAVNEHYKEILKQLERETAIQNERADEYEDLVNRVHQLSASLSRDASQTKIIRDKRQIVISDKPSSEKTSKDEKQTSKPVQGSAKRTAKNGKPK